MPNPNPPKIQFLRDLMPPETPESVMQAEEARLMGFVAILERIADRLERNASPGRSPGYDSTQSHTDSIV